MILGPRTPVISRSSPGSSEPVVHGEMYGKLSAVPPGSVTAPQTRCGFCLAALVLPACFVLMEVTHEILSDWIYSASCLLYVDFQYSIGEVAKEVNYINPVSKLIPCEKIYKTGQPLQIDV